MRLLIVVDMQNDFVTGALGTPQAQEIVPKIREKILDYIGEDDYVVATRDTHGGPMAYRAMQEGKFLPIPHCEFQTHGWEVVEELKFRENDHRFYLNKSTFGCRDIRWLCRDVICEKPDVIEIVGVCTDICVISNALMLKTMYPEAQIYVDANCCAGTSQEKHRAALKVMESCQIIVER